MVVHYLIINYGYERGYNEDPDFARAVNSVQDNIIYNNYVRDQINANLNPTEDELKQYYDAHKDSDYIQKATVQVQEVLVKDQARADSIYQKILAGADIGLMARKYTERRSARERAGELAPFVAGRYDEMGAKAFTMDVGEISPPIKTRSGYSIIKLLKKTSAGPESYDRVKNRVKNDINQQMRKKRADERYDMLAKKYDVAINYENAMNAYRANNKSSEAAS